MNSVLTMSCQLHIELSLIRIYQISFMKRIKTYIARSIRAIAAISLIAIVPIISGCGSSNPGYLVNLEIWGTRNDSTSYNEIIGQYKKLNPYIGDIKYRKFSESTYRQELLDALASGNGPDIFLVNNTWLPSFQNKLEPAPPVFVSGLDVRNSFPDTVASDFVAEENVYALPLSMDSMVLYYNKDMFNAAGITEPPKSWQEFDDDVAKLTMVDSVGNIVRSGAAIGTAQNVSMSSDLLSLMMMQHGVQFPTKKGMLTRFDEGVVGPGGTVVQAGERALAYYTKFSRVSDASNASSSLYTWNSRQKDSIEAFSEGTVGMMFNYYYKYGDIKSKNPKLNFAVATVPQFDEKKPVTWANYWGYAVAKNKIVNTQMLGQQPSATPVTNEIRTREAWQFLRFLALKNSGKVTLYNAVSGNSKDFAVNFDPAFEYLKNTNLPAARRDIIEQQKTDPVLSVFSQGNLIAKSWYQVNPDLVVSTMKNIIDQVNRGELSLHEALVLAKNRINSYN